MPEAAHGEYPLPNLGLDLLKRLLEKNHKARITATEALDHGFFNQSKLSANTMEEESTTGSEGRTSSSKQPLNKTSILVGTKTSVLNSPLMTSANPFRKNQPLLKDDSCVKFKMRENVMTGKTESMESHNHVDSPLLKRNMSTFGHQQSRFGDQKRMDLNEGGIVGYLRLDTISAV